MNIPLKSRNFTRPRTIILRMLKQISQLLAIRSKFRAAIDSGRKSGRGRVVFLFFDICQDIWGGSPAIKILPTGIEKIDIDEHSLEYSILCQS